MATVWCLQHPLRTLSSLLGQPATPAIVPAVPWRPETLGLSFQGANVMSRWGKKWGENEGLWGGSPETVFIQPLSQIAPSPSIPETLAPPVPKNFVDAVVLLLPRFAHCPREIWLSQISVYSWAVHLFLASALSCFGLFSSPTIGGVVFWTHPSL